MEPQLFKQQWVGLPAETKEKLKEIFNLRRDEGCIVNDGKIQSDGYSDQALSSINIKTLQEVTGSKTKDFVELFKILLGNIAINKAQSETPAQIEVYKEEATPEDKAILAEPVIETPVVGKSKKK